MVAEELAPSSPGNRVVGPAASETCHSATREGKPDIVDIADALDDLVYLANRAAARFGVSLDPIIAETHRSNMTKPNAEGEVIRRHDGKILKS